MIVNLVNVQTSDGLRLDGIWRKPPQANASQLGVDLVILHHGLSGNFYGAGMFEEYTDALVEKGCAVMRVNNRGHHPINRGMVGGESKRLGAAYELVDECRYDWEAWLDLAQAAGYRRVALWGHSLGAVKSIYYMSTQHDPRVNYVVASSPPRFSYSALQKEDGWKGFKRECDRAQQLIDQGHPETLMDVDFPRELLVTAEVFIDKYGPDGKYDIVQHIPNVKVPLLVTLGGLEGVVMGEGNSLMQFAGLATEMEKMSGELENLTFEPIPEADHVYTGQREYAWNVIGGWLNGS